MLVKKKDQVYFDRMRGSFINMIRKWFKVRFRPGIRSGVSSDKKDKEGIRIDMKGMLDKTDM